MYFFFHRLEMCFGIFWMVSQIFINPIFAIGRTETQLRYRAYWPGRQGRQLQPVGVIAWTSVAHPVSKTQINGPGFLSPPSPASFCPLLGKFKWKKSCTGFRSRRGGLWCAWTRLRLHARPQAQQVRQHCGKEREWVLEVLSPWRSGQSSEGLRLLMTPKLKQTALWKLRQPEMNFLAQADDCSSLHPGIINVSPLNCNLKSPPQGRCTAWDVFPSGTPVWCYTGLPNTAHVCK